MDLNIPNHLAIIIDGNRRWAKNKGLSGSKGHLDGAKNIIKVADYAFKKGVKVLSIFAFSTENFKRNKEEVDYLMNLFAKFFMMKLKTFKEKKIKVLFSGREVNLPLKVLNVMKKVSNETANNTNGTLNICLNYGGQSEIIDAVKKIVDNKVDIKELNEESFKLYLYNELPDVDLVIRTSGEERISNFMLYQLAYAELYFTDTYWPDFKEKDLDEVFNEFNQRKRRFGGN